jgi:hypothetical protein
MVKSGLGSSLDWMALVWAIGSSRLVSSFVLCGTTTLVLYGTTTLVLYGTHHLCGYLFA